VSTATKRDDIDRQRTSKGVCYVEGDVHPDVDCLKCDSTRPLAWSAATGSACDDGNACTTTDTCNAVATCVPGPARTCDDGTTCTDDSCDPGLGCVFAPVMDGTACDDGVLCNGRDSCAAGACSTHVGFHDCGYKMYCHRPSDACQRCGDAGFVCCPDDFGNPDFCFPSTCCSDGNCRNTC
jgi:hypothetical protein